VPRPQELQAVGAEVTGTYAATVTVLEPLLILILLPDHLEALPAVEA